MKTIFFDFDGTLADTGTGIVNGYNYAFDKKGIPRVPEDAILENIGPPLKEVLVNLYPTGSENDIYELTTLYREYFSSVGLYELEFFDGIFDMLDDLSRRGVQLCILSSKPTVFIENILEKNSLSEYFTRIDGVSLGNTNKTKKERLIDQIDNNGLDPNECIVVGDRREDMDAAQHCGTDFIGVLFGFGCENELSGALTAKGVSDLRIMLTAWMDD